VTAFLPDGAAPQTLRTAPRSPHWLLDQLPVRMLDGDFFVRFVSIFQDVASTLLEDADNIDNVADLSVAPAAMVRWLNSWIGGASIDSSLPIELQRRIVRSAAQTLTWRGTAHGVQRFLEIASGGPAQVSDGGGVWRDGEAPADTAWVRMSVSSTGWLPEAEFIELVRDEIPAHARAELYVGERRVWDSSTEAVDD
jgi:phage tail-like protein